MQDGGARASSDVVPDADQALQCASAPELSVSAPPAPIPEPGATELATGLAMGSPLVPVPGPGATELAMGLAMGPPLAPAPGLKPAPGPTIQGLAIPAMPPIQVLGRYNGPLLPIGFDPPSPLPPTPQFHLLSLSLRTAE